MPDVTDSGLVAASAMGKEANSDREAIEPIIFKNPAQADEAVAELSYAEFSGGNSSLTKDIERFYSACHLNKPWIIYTVFADDYLQFAGKLAAGLRATRSEWIVVVSTIILPAMFSVCSVIFWESPFLTVILCFLSALTTYYSSCSLTDYQSWVQRLKRSGIPLRKLPRGSLITMAPVVSIRGALAAQGSTEFSDILSGKPDDLDFAVRFGTCKTLPASAYGPIEAVRSVAGNVLDDDLPLVLQASRRLSSYKGEIAIFHDVALVFTPIYSDREGLGSLSPMTGVGSSTDQAKRSGVVRESVRNRDFPALRKSLSVKKWPEIGSRQAIIEDVGVGIVVDSFSLSPVSSDTFGELFRLPHGDDFLCWIRVADRVTDQYGSPIFRWLAVPSYIATPREGAAWTFGLSASAYCPTHEE